MQPDTDLDAVELSRSALRTSRRVTQDDSTLLRSGNFESTDDSTLEVPTPLTDAEEQPVRVLHVDDDPGIADITSTFLERINDEFEVTTETSVVAALDRLDGDIDCIISDYEMPNTDGLEFLEIVREQYPDLPFILFTGKGSEEIASEAIAAGVTDYMQKGSGTDQYEVLSNRVENAVEQYRTQQQFWDALSWYQRLVEQGVAGVFVVQDGELVYVNRKFAEIFGYCAAELVGESPLALVTAEDRDETLERLDGCDHGTFQHRFTGRGQDGERLDLEIHGRATAYDGEPAVTGILRQVDGGDG
jgi:PAS domain S-box-containing protein